MTVCKFFNILFSVIISFSLLAITNIALAVDSHASSVHEGKYPIYPKINYGAGAKAKLLKRGEYLVKLGDCIACHTKEGGGKSFAGGLAIKTPFGTIYTPNITPDKKTGIGSWTDKQFIRVMHEGISPKGKYYYPAFPYLYFNKVTKKDLLAIRAYLNAIPAIQQKNQKNKMMFPFNWRFLQLGWRMLFFQFQKTGAFKPNPKKSAQWNRGAYIVQGLGHCGMCHTPMHYLFTKKLVLGAPNNKYRLSGSFVNGFYAPNITSLLMKNVPPKELADVFLHDRLIGGGKVEGPMKEANHDSLKYLKFSDIKAIAVYLKSIKGRKPPQPASHVTGLGEGKKIFNQYCQACHLTGAGGAPKVGDAAAWDPLIKKGLNTLYKNAINGIGGMPAKGTCMSCTKQQIQEAVRYMASQSHSRTAKVLGHATNAEKKTIAPKPLTITDGKKIYEDHCHICHDGSLKQAPKLGDKKAWAPIIKLGMDTLITRVINGYKLMPVRGGCAKCTDAEIKAAVVYMVESSKTQGDYRLWLEK